jgi:hypothetical protein
MSQTEAEKIYKILSMKRVLVSSDVYKALQALPQSLLNRFDIMVEECRYLAPNTIMGIEKDEILDLLKD